MLLQVIREGLGLGALLVLVCAVGICKGAVGSFGRDPLAPRSTWHCTAGRNRLGFGERFSLIYDN